MSGGVQIGKVSDATGLSVDAIRFYEKQRLLDRPLRTEGGFRLFQREDIARIQFIRQAQQLGFSLAEIRELLILQHDGREGCSHVRDLLRAKLAAVRGKIWELRRLEGGLARSLRNCQRHLNAREECEAKECPTLKAMARRRTNEN